MVKDAYDGLKYCQEMAAQKTVITENFLQKLNAKVCKKYTGEVLHTAWGQLMAPKEILQPPDLHSVPGGNPKIGRHQYFQRIHVRTTEKIFPGED